MLNENGQKVDKNRNILIEIANKTKQRIDHQKTIVSLETIKQQAYCLPKGNFSFEKALKENEMSYICEIKKASPSKGLIAKDFPYLKIAKEYQQIGATCISCLTEPEYFLGKNKYLKEISQAVDIPVLKKDFFVDEYMIYEAKIDGASAILLICSLLDDNQLKEYFSIAEDLGLSAIFEAHDELEVQRANQCGARIIGVNNRNLKTFELDINNSIQLRKLVSNDILFISESGIQTREDILQLQNNNVHAVLIGEAFMKAPNKLERIRQLRGQD
ncbi:indole-3-glycerol phosphate synthase TrpC [Tannockella kyphosi]|uniref:indole-3-glycerol phosphate synthase TrpC n=1 Tax=Tannockella kyphosi TaxID=2899121 RepID=UPI00201168F8|nr:indole-3-glycerol phosphate synthase TrpC [Tannockella kyphosi]